MFMNDCPSCGQKVFDAPGDNCTTFTNHEPPEETTMLTIHKDSHIHDNVPQLVRDWVIDHLNAKELPSFLMLTLSYPSPIIPCGLHGPIMGDAPIGEVECFYGKRGKREYNSRLCNRSPRLQCGVTIIAGEHDGQEHVIYTMFGGPLAEKEPADPTLKDSERDFSVRFWREHALSKED